ETERKEMADLIAQDKLIEIKGRRPTQRLSDVFVRPGLEGKRVPGELEIHENGLRYHSHRTTQKLDILFSNIQHLFFQPCDNELIVLLHIHLNNPVIHGKKKTKDIQFYREASDVQFDETALLNKEFKQFTEKVAEASEGRVDVDIPFREIGFQGVPFRTNVLLQPTTECLVHLTDPPFLVVPLAEIEIAHLERVQFGLKNFDLVFIFKDYTRPPVHINTIPMNQLENVKDWLDSVDVNFYEGTQNLNWAQIMKTINSDPADFFEQGGWSFLKLHSENEDSAASSDSASEYMQSEDSFEESSSDGSSLDEDASDVIGSESEEETDESAPDWDEHEEKARRADERKHGIKDGEDSDDDHKKNKKYRR
ncbi:15500_t:CDS:10, partial [Cetraspora pellucida]